MSTELHDPTTVTRTVTIASRVGLHARPATLLVRTATAQPVPVRIGRPGGALADARSLLSVLALGAAQGDELVLEASGVGAAEAVDAVAALLEQDLDTDG